MSVSATNPEALATPPRPESAVRRQMAAATGRIKRLKRIDRAAVGIITFGGIAVVLSVVGILVFIGVEAIPLLRGASAQLAGTIRLGGAAAQGSMERRALGSDEFGRYVYTVEPTGKVAFINRGTGQPSWRSARRRSQGRPWSRRHGRCSATSSRRRRPTGAWCCCRCASSRYTPTAPCPG